MKHILMSLMFASASISAVAQDIQIQNLPTLSETVAKAKTQIETNQRIISDYLETAGHGATPFNNGETMIGSFYSQEMLKPFVGCRIKSIRVLSTDASRIKSIFVREGSTIYDAIEVKTEEPLGNSIDNNWYETKLNKDIEITPETKGLAIGYNLNNEKQGKITIGMNGVDSYKGNIYTFFDETNEWVNRSANQQFTLPVQLVVEPAAGTTMSEIVVSHIEVPNYTEVGKPLNIDYWITNASATPINNFELEVKVDNKSVKTITVDQEIKVGETNKKFSIEEIQPNISVVGKHDLALVLTKINGTVLTNVKGVENNHKVLYYKDVVARQNTLVEEFTSERCVNCYRGVRNIKALKQRQPDMVMVAVHLDEIAYPDDVAATESQFLKRIANVIGIPSFACNRVAFSINKKETIANPSIAAETSPDATAMIDKIYNYSKANTCVFSTLAIANKYDKDNKKINITVTGTGVNKAKELLEDYALFVLITENNVDGHQGNESGMTEETKHQNVLRAYVSDVKGDNNLMWEGNNFTKTYDFAIQNSWKPVDLEVVAFIAPKIKEIGANLEMLAVQNCVSQPLVNDPNAIENITTVQPIKVVERYNIKGQRIAMPQKGINIVKLSNGKVVKEIVK